MRKRKRFDRAVAVCAEAYARARAKYDDSQWWWEKAAAISEMISDYDRSDE